MELEPDIPLVVKFQIYYPDETYTLTDGTYKLTWLGNAILIVGSSNFDRVFHPVGLACCSREAQLIFKKFNYYNSITLNKNFLFSFDYKFVFDSVCLGRDKLELEPLTKLALMADYATAVRKQ